MFILHMDCNQYMPEPMQSDMRPSWLKNQTRKLLEHSLVTLARDVEA